MAENMYASLRKKFQDEFQIENPDKIIMCLVAIITFFDKDKVIAMTELINSYVENLDDKKES